MVRPENRSSIARTHRLYTTTNRGLAANRGIGARWVTCICPRGLYGLWRNARSELTRVADPRGPSMSRLGLTCCTRTVGPNVRLGWRNGTGLHTALGYSNPANLINNCHDEIRKASLVQLICRSEEHV